MSLIQNATACSTPSLSSVSVLDVVFWVLFPQTLRTEDTITCLHSWRRDLKRSWRAATRPVSLLATAIANSAGSILRASAWIHQTLTHCRCGMLDVRWSRSTIRLEVSVCGWVEFTMTRLYGNNMVFIWGYITEEVGWGQKVNNHLNALQKKSASIFLFGWRVVWTQHLQKWVWHGVWTCTYNVA